MEAKQDIKRQSRMAIAIQTALATRHHMSPLADDIGARIVAGEFQVGEVLSERMFGDQNVSRTSFREAIKVLAGKGMVRARPNTGTTVTPRSAWSLLDPDVMAWRLASGDIGRFIQDFFVFRQSIEPLAAATAAEHQDAQAIGQIRAALEEMRHQEARDPFGRSFVAADVTFHKAIFLASNNEFLIAMGNMLEMPLTLSFSLHSSLHVGPANRLDLHEDVLREIAAGRAEAARTASMRLLEGVAHHVHDVVTDNLGLAS